MKVYSTTDGTPQDVPDQDVPAALQSGQYGLPAGSVIPYQDVDGSIKSVPIEQSHTIDWTLASVVPHSALEAQQLQATYGGLGQQIKTGAEGLASGATLGVSDLIEGAALGNTEDIEARRKANPWTAGITQAGGALAPALLAPEAGAEGEVSALGRLGQIGAAPTRGVGLAGGAAEDAMRSLIGAGEGDSFVAALAKQAAVKGAGAATEGAIYGAAQHLDEQSLGDPDALGESLLAATGHGALLGLGLGGALSVGSDVASAAMGRAAPHLSGLAEESAVRAVSPKAADALEDLPGGVRAAGRRLLDDGLMQAGDTSESVAKKLPGAIDAANARAAKVLESTDASVPIAPVLEDGQKEIERLRAVGAHDAADALRGHLDAIESAAGVPKSTPLQEALEQLKAKKPLTPEQVEALKNRVPGDGGAMFDRRAVLESASIPLKAASELQSALEGPAKGLLQREIDEAGEAAAKKLGGSTLADYQDARLAADQYRALLSAPPAPPRPFGGSLSLLGMLHSGPVGAAAGAALSLAKQFASERGHSTAAVVLDKLASLRGIEQASQRMDRQIARGLAGISGERKAAVSVGEAAGGNFQERVAAVQRAAADPQAAADAAVVGIADHAPQTAAAFRQAATRATVYLAAQIPKTPPRGGLTPQLDTRHPASASQQRVWMQKFDVAHNPAHVLSSAHAGTVTPAQVQTLAAVYPALNVKVQKAALARLADRKKPLSQGQRTGLSLLTGRPQHSPDVARAFQATFAATEAPKQNQDKKHANKEAAPRRTQFSQAKSMALDVGRPIGS